MKNEYHFTISRTDRMCLVVFVILLLGWELIKYFFPPPPYDKEWIHHEGQPLAEQEINDSLSRGISKEKESYHSKTNNRKEYKSYDEIEVTPTPMDINKATWHELRAMGFSGKVASNIERYVGAGGVLKNQQDVMKIYSMDSAQWIAVAPFVLFPEKKNETTYQPWQEKNTTAVPTTLDLNTATAAELEMLPGIGAVLAERIIKYRTSLGGFFNIEQIKECYGLPPETIEKIIPRLTIVTPPTLITINEKDMTNFHHPYLNKKITRILQAYKKQHGTLKDVNDLRKIYPPDTTWCDRILPYIVFK